MCFVPLSDTTHGLQFIWEDDVSYEKKYFTLKEWQETGDDLALRTSTHIARICIYPGATE
jgi:hypothetical protein